jgi:hypothetical protein
VVSYRWIFVSVSKQLNGCADEQQPEDEEHETERREQGGAERDEDRAQHQRGDDPEGEHLVLVLGGHREGGHDDHEDEQVVDAERLLDNPAREVLRSVVQPASHPKTMPKAIATPM